MQALAGTRIAAAVLALFTGTTVALAQEDLDDLEVTMEVVDNVVELESAIGRLRGPGERGDFSADAEGAADAVLEVPAAVEAAAAARGLDNEGRDAFADDGLGELSDAAFEAQDDFEEGEDVDEDQFDELPEPMPDPVP